MFAAAAIVAAATAAAQRTDDRWCAGAIHAVHPMLSCRRYCREQRLYARVLTQIRGSCSASKHCGKQRLTAVKRQQLVLPISMHSRFCSTSRCSSGRARQACPEGLNLLKWPFACRLPLPLLDQQFWSEFAAIAQFRKSMPTCVSKCIAYHAYSDHIWLECQHRVDFQHLRI